jgi:2-dehydropantoate 2-reductase
MPEKVVRWSQEIRDIHTSMYDDWKAGRRTEIDYLNGYIVRRARECGIPVPVNEALSTIIKVITEREPTTEASVTIDGAVIQPVRLDRSAFSKLAAEHQVSDLPVLQSTLQARGITLRGLLQIPALELGVDHVTLHSRDGRFAASLTLEQAREHGILVYEVEGGPLAQQHGGPFRLIAPGLGDLCANVKDVARIELTRGRGKDTRPSAKRSDRH